jgi:hypothetical protein
VSCNCFRRLEFGLPCLTKLKYTWTHVILGIQWDPANMLWTYNDNRSRFPSEQDRHYIQQQRLWKFDNVNFELGGTSNVAANETSKSICCCVFYVMILMSISHHTKPYPGIALPTLLNTLTVIFEYDSLSITYEVRTQSTTS